MRPGWRANVSVRRAAERIVPAAPARRCARRAAVALLTSLALASVARAAEPDSLGLEGRIVRHIVVDARSIFDPLPEPGRAFYALANRLHVVTRARTLRAALVVREGDAWSAARRDETLRHLRDLAYLLPDSVVATPVGSDSVDVRVVTHDNWTTSPEFSIESGGGQRFGAFALVERNFLGMGTSLSLVYRHDVTGISRTARIDDDEIFGTHWRGRVSYGKNDGGLSQGAQLALPFWADAAPYSLGVQAARDRYSAEQFADGEVASTRRVRIESSGVFAGLGRQTRAGTIERVVLSLERYDRDIAAAVLEPGAPSEFAGPAQAMRERMLALDVRVSKPRFLVRRGIDQMDRDEDIDVGAGTQFKAGWAPEVFGSTTGSAYTRAHAHAGLDAGRRGFGQVSASAQARWRPEARERFGELSARWVVQPRPALAALVGVLGMAGRDMTPDFQLTLGGINGLRAFPVHELTGTQLWRGNAEVRWIAARDVLRLVSFGGAAFWDGGRTWGRGTGDTLWHHDAGVGLRLSLPHSALNAVARFDVAWPLSPGHELRRGPAYSFGSGQVF